MNEPISDDELNAYVDGELSTEDRRRIETLLAADAEARERAAFYRAQRALLAAHLDRVVGQPSPRTRRLTDRLAGTRGHPVRIWSVRAAAALLLLAIGWQAHSLAAFAGPLFDRLMVPRFVEEAADAHATFSAMRAWYPLLSVEGARDAATAIGWRGLDAADGAIEKIGAFTLQGVALVPWDGGSALELVYVGPREVTVTLFVAAEDAEGSGEIDGVELDWGTFVFWRKDGFDYVVGGNLPPDVLGRFAHRVAAHLG
ncbi:MAG: anti-sigma factor [Alphaproteobacteria bacterium]